MLFLVVAAAGSLPAATITLAPMADTTLSQTIPDNNFGAELFVSSGSTDADALANRALLRFDIASFIPSNATIQNVTLTLNVTQSTATESSSFSLHRLLLGWGEGTKANSGGGAPASNGEATWSARLYPATLWSAPGGATPGDYVAGASATQAVMGQGSYVWGSSPALVADVQRWLTNAAQNFGWILISESEGDFGSSEKFASRENPGNGPKLVITYTLPPRPHVTIIPSADTSMLEAFPDNNAGTAALFSGGIGGDFPRTRALMQFSTEDIPADAVLTSATLGLTVYELVDDGTAHSPTFDLHRVLRPWREGNKGTYVDTFYYGAPADNAETTWNAQAFPSSLWSAPGGAAPTDYLAKISAQTVVSGFGTWYFTNLLADVQYWLAHPSENHGWILVCEQEAVDYTACRFSSREDVNLTNAPTLVVEYIPVPKIYRTELSGGQFKLYYVAQAGLASVVQYRNSLSTGNWITLTNVPATVVTQTNVISTTLPPPRFYRVGVQ